jgi:hypothetical protein
MEFHAFEIVKKIKTSILEGMSDWSWTLVLIFDLGQH